MSNDKLKKLEYELGEISDDLDQLILIGEDVFDMQNCLDRLI